MPSPLHTHCTPATQVSAPSSISTALCCVVSSKVQPGLWCSKATEISVIGISEWPVHSTHASLPKAEEVMLGV